MSKSSITTDGVGPRLPVDGLPPIHPGEMLADELEVLGMSEDFWLRLQTTYDIKRARAETGSRIADDVRPLESDAARISECKSAPKSDPFLNEVNALA